MVAFATDPQLLGLSLSPAQEALLRTIYGLPLAAEHLEFYRTCTGRDRAPAAPFLEASVIAGARSGKDSRIAAPVVCFEALFGGHETHLHRGERGVIALCAQDLRGTKVAFGYIRDYLTRSPLLASTVAEVLSLEIALANGLTIACFPCTQRSLRGWSLAGGVMDELAFYRLEGQADSDVEIQTSIRRGMIGFPAPRLVKISTPYMRSGVLFEDFRRAWGQDDPDLLVWRAASTVMNPTLAEARLERERRCDPLRFAREYEAAFAEDLEAFLPAAWVEAAVVVGRRELPTREGVGYAAAVDPSGGGADAFTLAIAHREGDGSSSRVVLDVLRGWARVGSGLEAVVEEVATTVRRYGLREVVGDRYAAGWVRGAFEARGVRYVEAPVDKSAAYLELEPLLAQGRLELLDHPVLARELVMLERRPRPGGKTLVDHPRGGHDDHANAVALAVLAAAGEAAVADDALGSPDELRGVSAWTGLEQLEAAGTRGGFTRRWDR